jgi:hypothetical protein
MIEISPFRRICQPVCFDKQLNSDFKFWQLSKEFKLLYMYVYKNIYIESSLFLIQTLKKKKSRTKHEIEFKKTKNKRASTSLHSYYCPHDCNIKIAFSFCILRLLNWFTVQYQFCIPRIQVISFNILCEE